MIQTKLNSKRTQLESQPGHQIYRLANFNDFSLSFQRNWTSNQDLNASLQIRSTTFFTYLPSIKRFTLQSDILAAIILYIYHGGKIPSRFPKVSQWNKAMSSWPNVIRPEIRSSMNHGQVYERNKEQSLEYYFILPWRWRHHVPPNFGVFLPEVSASHSGRRVIFILILSH